MSRKTNTEQRRRQIVEALQSVIAKHGYEGATIQLIAREAGLTAGLIHYHFHNKREILIALVTVLSGYVLERHRRGAEAAASPRERLRAYIDARLGLGRGAKPDAVAAWIAIGAEAVRQPEVREAYQEAIARELRLVRALLGDYLEQQHKSRDSARRQAAVLMAFIEGAFQLSAAAARVMPKGYAAEAALLMVEGFVAGAPDAVDAVS
jgi:TetR/AcrR family transcriptional regulator, transcriptional repressor of bet genes